MKCFLETNITSSVKPSIMSCYFDYTSPAGASLILSWHFPKDIRTEDVLCAVKMNFSALAVFLSWISIMPPAKQAESELKTVLTF